MLAGNDCPHCQTLRDEIEVLRRALGDHVVVPRAFGLTRAEAKILRILMSSRLPYVTADNIMDSVYLLDDDPPGWRIICVFIHKIRRKLQKFDIAVGSKWGQGYFLTPDDRAKINRMAAAELEQSQDEGCVQ